MRHPFTTLRLSASEAKVHTETVSLAMQALAKGRQSTDTALLWQRLNDLLALLERGIEDEGPSPLVDVWQRPKVRQILSVEGDERAEALTPGERQR